MTVWSNWLGLDGEEWQQHFPLSFLYFAGSWRSATIGLMTVAVVEAMVEMVFRRFAVWDPCE